MKTIVDEINELRTMIAKYEERKERAQSDLSKCLDEMKKAGFANQAALQEGIAKLNEENLDMIEALQLELDEISEMIGKYEPR